MKTIIDFMKMRVEIKKPMTDRARLLMLKKLKVLSGNEEIQIKILENSIENCWQGIFPIKIPKCYRKPKRANGLKTHIEIIKKVLKDREKGREIMNSQGIMGNLNYCIQALNKGNTELKILGVKKAQAEKAYRVKKAEEILKIKEEKHPVTLIMEIVKETEEVAQLKSQRDISESDYHNCISAIDNLKVEIDAIRSKLNWLRVQLGNL